MGRTKFLSSRLHSQGQRSWALKTWTVHNLGLTPIHVPNIRTLPSLVMGDMAQTMFDEQTFGLIAIVHQTDGLISIGLPHFMRGSNNNRKI